jgi:hypothetical protein
MATLLQRLEELRLKYAAAEQARIAAEQARIAETDKKTEADKKAWLQRNIRKGFRERVENRPEKFPHNQFLKIPYISEKVSKELINSSPSQWADTVQEIVFSVIPKKDRPSVYGDQLLRAKAIIHHIQQNNITNLYLMDGIGRFLSIVIKMAVRRRLNLHIYVVEIDSERSSFHKRFFPQKKADGVQVTCLSEKDICVVAKELSSNLDNRQSSFVYANFCSLASGKERDKVIELSKNGDIDMISFDKRNYHNRDGQLTIKGEFITWLNNNAITKYNNTVMQRKTFASYLLVKSRIDGSSKRRSDHLANNDELPSKRPRS